MEQVKVYCVVLTNGESIKIKATEIIWFENSRTLQFLYGRVVVARINMDNVVGWTDVEYIGGK